MATSYKTLYRELQQDFIRATRLNVQLTERLLKSETSKEKELEASAIKLQATMSAMAAELTKKVASQKKTTSSTAAATTSQKPV